MAACYTHVFAKIRIPAVAILGKGGREYASSNIHNEAQGHGDTDYLVRGMAVDHNHRSF